METAIQETNHQSSGIALRVWERIARQLESRTVEDTWNEALRRIAREARPGSTSEELAHAVERWRFLTKYAGVAASTADIVLAAAATGAGMYVLGGIRNFTPIDLERFKNLARTMAPGKSKARQWVEIAGRQTAYSIPLFGAAAGVVAARPARVGLTFVGEAAGAAGEKVTRIMRRIVSGADLPDSADRAVYYGMGKP